MKRTTFSSRSASRLLSVLIGAVALTLVACDNDVNFSPTAPGSWDIKPVGERSLLISGSLVADEDSCLEATILFDGRELAGARTLCSRSRGCAELKLEAMTQSGSGRHTISFQVLDQSVEAIDYLARGQVLVTREGLQLGGVHMNLGPERATLRRGDRVTFEVIFTD